MFDSVVRDDLDWVCSELFGKKEVHIIFVAGLVKTVASSSL